MSAQKTRITILVDSHVLTFFRARAARRGAEPYQTQINRLLRQYVADVEPLLGGGHAGVAEPRARYRSIGKVVRARTAPSPRRALQHTVKAVARPGEEFGWVARCIELPVATQGMTLDEVAANLREAVALHLEGEDPATFGLSPDPCLLLTLELPVKHVQAPTADPARRGQRRRASTAASRMTLSVGRAAEASPTR